MKDATIAGFVAFGLFFFMIGLRTDQGSTGALEISTRFQTFAIIVAVVFAGSFLRTLAFGRGPIPLGAAVALAPAVNAASRFAGPALLIFALLVPVLFYGNRYILDLGILVLTYVMLGWGLNIVVGLAGLLDLGYVAFYAVGAYSYALLATNFHLSFWICLPLAGILAAFWGILLGFPVLRLRGDYLAIVTLAFGEIIRLVLLNWQSLTGGPNGIPSIPRPSFFGLPFTDAEGSFASTFGLDYSPTHRVVFLFYLILALALLTNFVTLRLRRLPIGRAWEAMREDEIACRSLGINTTTTKLTAFAIGAMFGGFAGSFFATRQGFICAGELQLQRIRADPRHRRARRHGQPARRRGRRPGHARRLRAVPRIRALPHAGVRRRDGADHDLAAARPGLDPRAVAAPRRAQDSAGHERHADHADRCADPPGRASVDAVRRPGRRRRPVVHRQARRHHRADRAERRRQDHRVQLHHRLLQADRGADPPRTPRRQRLPAGAAARTSASPSSPRSPARSRTSGCSPA